MKSYKLTYSRLHEVLRYEPETGEFFWKVSPTSRIPVGARAGTRTAHGYLGVKIDGVLYPGHRLAVIYMTGGWPPADVDHIDGNRANDRWTNLRSVSRALNVQNQTKVRSHSKTGLMGVKFVKARNTYRSTIEVDGKRINVGSSKDPQALHEKYIEFKRRLHPGFQQARVATKE